MMEHRQRSEEAIERQIIRTDVWSSLRRRLVRRRRTLSWSQALVPIVIATIGWVGFGSGCGREADLGSNPYQLTEKNFTCDRYDDAVKSDRLKTMPPRFVNEGSFRVGRVEDVRNQLAGIPVPLMEYLYGVHRQNGLTVSESPLRGSTIGVTTLVGFRGGTMVPTSIAVTNRPEAIIFALQHEVGHAVEGHVRRLKQTDPRQWQGAFNEGRSNAKIRSYARSEPAEYFAEAFANFYCSPAAHDFIKTELPQTYAQLKTMLPPPSWEEGNGGSSGGSTQGPDKGLYVLIDDENPAAAYLYVSAPEKITTLRACKAAANLQAEKPACVPGASSEIALEPVDHKVQGRKVLRSKNPVDPKDLGHVHLVGLGAQGETVEGRTLKFQERT